MQTFSASAAVRWLSIGFISHLLASNLFAAAIWRTAGNGLWRDGTNWSTTRPPALDTGTTYFTNAGTKTVTVDAPTANDNLVISAMTIGAPGGAVNTLRLSGLGAARPLAIANNRLTLAQGGALHLIDSSLVVTGRFIDLNVLAGDITLDSGSIIAREVPLTTNVTVITRLARTNNANLTINGGEMQVTQLLVGDATTSQFRPRGTIRLSGGRLSVAGELSLGDSDASTGILQMSGGELLVGDQGTNVMRVGDHGRGEMTVANAFANVGNVSVARHDTSVGVLTLQNGGVMRCSDDFSIGRFPGSTGLVHLAGGSFVVTNHPIWVGREGFGQLAVSNGFVQTESLRVAAVRTNTGRGLAVLAGGTTVATSNLLVGDGVFTNAVLAMTGGNLWVTNSIQAAYINAASGSMTLSGGTSVVDRVFVTNNLGRLIFNGGTLRTRGTTVANGTQFVVGDGVRPATLVLDGGVHSFANGLVISANATLAGCGTVVGNIVNRGTIATNCGPVVPRLAITRAGNGAVNLSFPAQSGRTYFVEFNNALTPAGWTVLATRSGTGATENVNEPTVGRAARFFRLRVQ